MKPLARIARVARTLRHLRFEQMLAQSVHAVRGVGSPIEIDGPAPSLAVTSSPSPFPGPAAHARFEPGPRITLLGVTVEFGSGIDWDFEREGPLFAYHLHQFEYLRAASADPELRIASILDWIHRHPRGIGWDPHPVSLRLLAWGKLLLTEGALPVDPAARAEMRASMARQAETLSRHLEVRLQANHLMSNLIGVVFAGLLFDGAAADRWLALHHRLEDEIARQILPDGLHEERSPMYHSLLLENLLDLLNLARAAAPRAPKSLINTLETTSAAMLEALSLLCHPDGEIALFGDSAFGIAQSPDRLRVYAASIGVPVGRSTATGLLPRSGFARLSSGPFCLIASLAGPSPAHQPGHAHCDALSFELSCGDRRVVTDTGVCEYRPGERRRVSRATASHSTIEVDGREQAEIWAAHRIGGRPQVVIEGIEPGTRAVASCRSWSTPDTLHRREFAVRDGAIEIRDSLIGRALPVRLLLPLAPGLEPRLSHDPDRATLAHIPLGGGRRIRIALPAAARWAIERSDYYPEFGRVVSRACLVGVSSDFDTGTWRFDLGE